MRAADLECELREMAGLVSGADLSGEVLDRVRKRLHGLADRVRAEESPYLTLSAAARRYGIDPKDMRELVEIGEVQVAMIAGRRRIDIRQFAARNSLFIPSAPFPPKARGRRGFDPGRGFWLSLSHGIHRPSVAGRQPHFGKPM